MHVCRLLLKEQQLRSTQNILSNCIHYYMLLGQSEILQYHFLALTKSNI